MKISAKTEYACKALLELAEHWPNKQPMSIYTISQREAIPLKFLTHILLTLKQLGFVESVRGKNGGYLLAKSPDKISLRDVFTQFDGFFEETLSQDKHIITTMLNEVNFALCQKLSEYTLESIKQARRQKDKMLDFVI